MHLLARGLYNYNECSWLCLHRWVLTAASQLCPCSELDWTQASTSSEATLAALAQRWAQKPLGKV